MTYVLRVGFTGTRNGMTRAQLAACQALLNSWRVLGVSRSLAHGDCVGADSQADYMARKLNYNIIIHPPQDPRLQANCYKPGDQLMDRAVYHVRNINIIRSCERLIATPKDMNRMTGGTFFTIEYARKEQAISLYVIRPDGVISHE